MGLTDLISCLHGKDNLVANPLTVLREKLPATTTFTVGGQTSLGFHIWCVISEFSFEKTWQEKLFNDSMHVCVDLWVCVYGRELI